MQPTSRTIAVLLLVTIAAALPGAQALAFAAPQPEHPAGCHRQNPATPTPARNNYQCCVNGHHHAMASASFSLHPLVALFDRDAGEGLWLYSGFSYPAAALAIPSTSPPGISPLRI